MKTLSIGFALLVLVALPAAAAGGDAPTLEPLHLDGTPAGACEDPADRAVRTSIGGGIGEQSTCTAEADCSSGTVKCTGDNVCEAVDRDCSVGQRGYVECDGVRTNCESCPSSCTCQQGASCTDDSDCDCNQGFGFCDKEPWEIVGSCSCYF